MVPHMNKDATRNKCIATSNKCLTSSNKKLVETMFATRNKSFKWGHSSMVPHIYKQTRWSHVKRAIAVRDKPVAWLFMTHIESLSYVT